MTDSGACVPLRILIDSVPAYPLGLDEQDGAAGTYMRRRHRPIESMNDLERIGALLAALAG